MRRRLRAWRGVWGSVAFRLTLNYSLLALLTSLAVLALFHDQAVRLLDAQFSRQVATTLQRLGAHFEHGGLPGLIAEIDLELGDQVNTDTEMFLLIGPGGRKLIGNIDLDPVFLTAEQSWSGQEVRLRGAPARGYLVAHRLPDGSRLIVGHDVRDLREITHLLTRISLVAIGLTAVLVLLGAWLFRRTLQRRVEVIRRTTARVGAAGGLTPRIPAQAHQDEFALLADDINSMLDRIERLMNGVRNVSDAVAHHLRTPLTRILARLRTLGRPGTPADEMRAGVDFLLAEIEGLADVSEKLLQIAELESGTRRKRFETVRLDAIARDVVDLYEALAEERRATLRLLPGGPVRVSGDRDLLAGAVASLVDNALKYAGEGADIRVEARQQEGAAAITVADDGPGIQPGKQERIGERFYRLNRDVPGYGLGLATVIAIARLHDAQFALRNGEPGLAVTLRFPAAADGGEGPDAETFAAPAPDPLAAPPGDIAGR